MFRCCCFCCLEETQQLRIPCRASCAVLYPCVSVALVDERVLGWFTQAFSRRAEINMGGGLLLCKGRPKANNIKHKKNLKGRKKGNSHVVDLHRGGAQGKHLVASAFRVAVEVDGDVDAVG